MTPCSVVRCSELGEVPVGFHSSVYGSEFGILVYLCPTHANDYAEGCYCTLDPDPRDF